MMINQSKTFNVVFDIDDVLADTTIRSAHEVKFYEQRGCVFEAAEKTHYIFPGVIEMMQLLFRMEDVRVSFFSTGHQMRNDVFVEKLLRRSLGEEEYLKIKNEAQILSGTRNDGSTDLSKSTNEESGMQWDKYRLFYGRHRKCLKKIVGEEGDLENCVLIDDDPSLIRSGQEKNYLHVRAIWTRDFAEMYQESKYYSYNEYGHKKIPFKDCGSSKYRELHKNRVINAEYIAVFFKKDKCILGYVDVEQKQYEEIEIFQESESDIFKELKRYYKQA